MGLLLARLFLVRLDEHTLFEGVPPVNFRLALAIAATCLSLSAPLLSQTSAPVIPAAAKAAEASIDADRIRAHVRFLSDDLLEGRGPGLRGGELAAKYIATQFELDGLKPGGLVSVRATGEKTIEFEAVARIEAAGVGRPAAYRRP